MFNQLLIAVLLHVTLNHHVQVQDDHKMVGNGGVDVSGTGLL